METVRRARVTTRSPLPRACLARVVAVPTATVRVVPVPQQALPVPVVPVPLQAPVAPVQVVPVPQQVPVVPVRVPVATVLLPA
jgi:hypothetical protein